MKKRDFSAIEERIKKVTELPRKVSMVTYGRPGTGKTTFAATMPGPILLLDAREEGTDSILDTDNEVMVLPVEDWDDFEMAYWFLQSKKGKRYQSTVIDTFTQVQDLCLKQILKETKKPHPTKREWGLLGARLKPWIYYYRDLPQNVMFLCHDRVTDNEASEDEDQIIPEVGPRLSPSIASALCGAVKVIGQTYIFEKEKKGKDDEDVEYRLRLGAHTYYTTKIRTGKKNKKPKFLVDPEFDDILKIMRGEYEPPAKPVKTNKKKKVKNG